LAASNGYTRQKKSYSSFSNSSTRTPELAAFQQDLSGLGYLAGDNLAITLLGSDNRPERLPSLAAKLVEQKVEVIFCTGS
jgi:hypothetical protein